MPSSQDINKPADISPLRPKFTEKTPRCNSRRLNETDIPGWITTLAQVEANGRTDEPALELA